MKPQRSVSLAATRNLHIAPNTRYPTMQSTRVAWKTATSRGMYETPSFYLNGFRVMQGWPPYVALSNACMHAFEWRRSIPSACVWVWVWFGWRRIILFLGMRTGLITKPCPLAAHICCTISTTSFSSVVCRYTELSCGTNPNTASMLLRRYQPYMPLRRCTPCLYAATQMPTLP